MFPPARLALLVTLVGAAARGLAAPAKTAGIPVATLVYAERLVEKEATSGQGWRRMQEGERFRTGDRVRVGLDALARFDFLWMSITAGPDTILRIPAERILSAVLDAGRAELLAPGQQIVKVRTADVEIRGEGRVVVKRDPQAKRVLVMAMDGSLRVEAAGKTAVLQSGEGTVIDDGQAPGAVIKLPPPPDKVWPGADPVYVKKGRDTRLIWISPARAHHVQVLPIDSNNPLISRDVGGSPYALSVPWLGTYRWRVSARDENGLEGRPSVFGYICVVER